MKKFYLRAKLSPTYYNLSNYLIKNNWQPSKFPFLGNFGEKNLKFNLAIANQLEFKHLLAELVQNYCPEVMPKTYYINDKNWEKILTLIQSEASNLNKTWILKPALLNNGQHILIFDNLENLRSHYLSYHRLGGDHVLQEYISSPHLLKGPKGEGHKYSIRIFMVLTNYDGAFLYPNGYFNIAVTPYNRTNFDDLTCHITNEHLQDDRVNVIQIPTFKYELFNPIYPKIKNILSQLISGLENKYPDIFSEAVNIKKLAIFGVDFMVDSEQRAWLIEANHGPCFPITQTHDLQVSLYNLFWMDLIDHFVNPIGDNISPDQILYNAFERL